MSTDWNDLKQELLQNEKVAAAYEALQPEYELARSIIRLRLQRSLTQKQLAEKMNTTQSVVSRLESGNGAPSLATLKKVARALDSRVVVRIEE